MLMNWYTNYISCMDRPPCEIAYRLSWRVAIKKSFVRCSNKDKSISFDWRFTSQNIIRIKICNSYFRNGNHISRLFSFSNPIAN